jgi:hypothetical protein
MLMRRSGSADPSGVIRPLVSRGVGFQYFVALAARVATVFGGTCLVLSVVLLLNFISGRTGSWGSLGYGSRLGCSRGEVEIFIGCVCFVKW